MKKIDIVICESNFVYQTGLRTILSNIGYICINDVCENIFQINDILSQKKIDVVLFNIEYIDIELFKYISELIQQNKKTKFISIANNENISFLDKLTKTGISAFLLKNIKNNDLENAINTVLDGEFFYPKEFEFILNKNLFRKKNRINLTQREIQILELICKGNSNTEIAKILNLSVKTIDGHRLRLMEKTQSKNAASLVMYAINNGLINN